MSGPPYESGAPVTPLPPPEGNGQFRFKHDPLHMTLSPTPFRFELAASFWRRVRCPVLVVEATESAFHHPPEEMERRLACLSNVERAALPDAGHMMHRHQPRALGALLARFLTEVE